MEVKKTQHRYIIGPKGNSINEILTETGVFVEMPSSDSNSETITLRGPQVSLIDYERFKWVDGDKIGKYISIVSPN